MYNFSTAIERKFQPSYSFSWYLTNLFILIVAGTYSMSKVLGEHVDGLIESIGIVSLLTAAFVIARTLKAVEIGPKVKLHYVFWPAKSIEYKDVLEIRLPEIAINAHKPIKLENIVNLDELQQEFKSLELMGVIPKGQIRELKPPPSQYSFKPKLGNIIGALFTLFVLVNELFRISQKTNVLWISIIVTYFGWEIFNRLFRKPKDE